jgi:hypothetical protein
MLWRIVTGFGWQGKHLTARVSHLIPADWQKNARVVPDQVMTQDGTANTSFDANMSGVVVVTAQVGSTTETARITITSHGSRVYDKRP